jgi:hypothetical protein
MDTSKYTWEYFGLTYCPLCDTMAQALYCEDCDTVKHCEYCGEFEDCGTRVPTEY